MQLARTLHSQATEKSFFVWRLSTWNTLSRGERPSWAHSGEGAPRTQSHPCPWTASLPQASSQLHAAQFPQTWQLAVAKWQRETCMEVEG